MKPIPYMNIKPDDFILAYGRTEDRYNCVTLLRCIFNDRRIDNIDDADYYKIDAKCYQNNTHFGEGTFTVTEFTVAEFGDKSNIISGFSTSYEFYLLDHNEILLYITPLNL